MPPTEIRPLLVHSQRQTAPPAKPHPLQVYSRRRPASPQAPSTPPLPKGVVPIKPITNKHNMTTRAKVGHCFPSIYNSMTLSPVPCTYRSALGDPNWRAAMEDEYSTLM